MTVVFCRVTAELSGQFVQIFPHQFDVSGLLKKIADDAGVTLSSESRMQNETSYCLQGLWPEMEKAHNMLLAYVYGSVMRCDQESPISQGSRPFSALVEAAEAMSRGADLQEQIEKELILTKDSPFNSTFPSDDYFPMTPVNPHEPKQEIVQVQNVHMVTCADSHQSFTHLKEKQGELCDFSALQGSEHAEDNANLVPGDSVQAETNDKIINEDKKKENGDSKCNSILHEPMEKQKTANSKDTPGSEVSKLGLEKSVPVKKRQTRSSAQQTAPVILAQNKFRNQKKTRGSQLQESKTEIEVKMPQEIEESLNESKKVDKNSPVMKDAVTQKAEKEEVLSCEFSFCGFVAKNRKAYTDHTQRVHLAEPSRCDICNKVFQSERYMKRHREIHDKPNHRCGKCGKMYKVLKALQHHIKTHDPNYKPPEFQCDECSKSFCSNYILMCHKKSEHLGMKKSYLCAICGKRFTTKHTLQQHVNVHTGVRPYECDTCGKSFNYESALRDHKFIHEGTKQFICSEPSCKKAFRQRSALKMHEKIHKPEKDFVCSECGRGFTQKQALQRHVRAHKGDKSFCCKICRRSFGDAAIVRRHLILVHRIHKDVNKWREDIITVPQQKEGEGSGETDDKSDSSQTGNVLNDVVTSSKHIEHHKTESVTAQTHTSLSQTTLLPDTEIHHKSYEASPTYVLQANQISDHHNTGEPVMKNEDLVTNKTRAIMHATEVEAMKYPTVHVHQSAAQSHGDILNYEYIVTPNDASYNHLARSSEVDHSSYTKSVLDKTIDELRVAPLTLTDAVTEAHLMESTREVPVALPEVSTVLAGTSREEDLPAARSLDQVKVRPEVMTAERIMEIVKQLQDADTGLMDPEQMQTLYSYYNVLASQYYSLAQYATLVPNTDNTGDHQ